MIARQERPDGVAEDDAEGPLPYVLVAGGRRLTALKRLQFKELRHGREFIFRDEIVNGDPRVALKMQAIEVEENVKRKSLTWPEEVAGKKRLFEIMTRIHGTSTGRPTKGQIATGQDTGFSIRKLASMLGEDPSNTSRDLQIADMVERVPSLAQADTKGSVMRQIGIAVQVHKMKSTASAKAVSSVAASNNSGGGVSAVVAKPAKEWVLYEGDWRQHITAVTPGSVDLVYTDLPFGVDLSNMSKHRADSVVSYGDARSTVVSMLADIAAASFQCLQNDRYGVFWFGFNYYTELVEALQGAGFSVSLVPFIWFKNTRSTENPNTRYANSYDPAIIAMKGRPVFMRPGQQNFTNIPPVLPSQRLQIAQQPVELVTKFLRDMITPGATVLDFCAGSGTTGEAALRFGAKAILFERDPGACTLIKARLGAI